MKKFAAVSVGVLALGLMVLPLVQAVQAQTAFTIIDYGSSVGLGTSDLKSTVLKIIQWVLGILALIAVVMIIYGGIIWMTAAGNEENVEKAKKIISAAVIGLIVVLLAWAIVIFVARTTKEVSTE